jgi:hypothetical protein
MRNKRKGKKRLARSLSRRQKEVKKLQKERLEKAWINIWVKAGILKREEYTCK